MAREAGQLAAGTLDPGCACMADLYPDDLLTATDTVLDSFDEEVTELDGAEDVQVFAAVERVVLALNAVDDIHRCGARPALAGDLLAIDEARPSVRSRTSLRAAPGQTGDATIPFRAGTPGSRPRA